MGEILLNYLILIIGIGLIGFFWSITAESKKDVFQMILTFVIWGVVSYSIQLAIGTTLAV